MKLSVHGVGFTIDGREILTDVGLDVPDGSMVGLVGPNGSGKSTLLRLLYRGLRPQSGLAHLDDRELWRMPPRTAALHLAAVPQEQPTEFDMQVVDLVRLGRLPHKGLFEGDREADRQVIHDSLARVGMSERGHRLLSELSGGERQRAVIARALAQQPSVLLLDEPTNHLDIRHQHDLLTLLRRLGITTLIAVHDLNLAAQYCDHVVVLRDGRVLAAGPVDEALTPDVIRQAFDVYAVQVRHPVTGSPQLLFHHNPEEKPA